MQTCQTCRFFKSDHYNGGHCKRFPPTVVAMPTTQRWQDDVGQAATLEQHWPWLAPAEWCGEWRGQPVPITGDHNA